MFVIMKATVLVSIDSVGTSSLLVGVVAPNSIGIIGLFTACITLFTAIGTAVIRSMDRANARVAAENERMQKALEYKDKLIMYWQARAAGIPVPPQPPLPDMDERDALS